MSESTTTKTGSVFFSKLAVNLLRNAVYALTLCVFAGLLAVVATWLLLVPLRQSVLVYFNPAFPAIFFAGAALAMVGSLLYRKESGILPGGLADVGKALSRASATLVVGAMTAILALGVMYLAGVLGASEEWVSAFGIGGSSVTARALFEAFCDWTRVPVTPAAETAEAAQ